ncbi:hypothetical protein [Lacticaseibacillus sp. GG6-2]
MSERQVEQLVNNEYPNVLQLIQDGLTEAGFVANGAKLLAERDGRPVFALFGPSRAGRCMTMPRLPQILRH